MSDKTAQNAETISIVLASMEDGLSLRKSCELAEVSVTVFLRWVDGVTIRNSTLGFAGEDRSDFAQGLLTQNCTSVQTMGLTAEAATPEYESVQLG